MSQHDDNHTRLQTEDIANADPRTDDARTDAEHDARADMESPVDDDRRLDDTRLDETRFEEPENRFDETPLEDARADAEPELPVDDDTRTEQQRPSQDAAAPAELFPRQEVEQFRTEWQDIQTRFVDDPRDAVQSADQLVAEVMRSLATTFTNHKHELEGQWQQGSEVETEDLRQALQRYRSFFNQLLEV